MKRDRRGYGYRDDEELYVDDQSCANCTKADCPMALPMLAQEHLDIYGTLADFNVRGVMTETREVQKRRSRDAIVKDGQPVWCIYWHGKGGRW